MHPVRGAGESGYVDKHDKELEPQYWYDLASDSVEPLLRLVPGFR